MKSEHKIIREMLGKMPIPAAKEILKTNLPPREYESIYLCDVEQWDLFRIADKLHCTDSNVKKIRRSGYEKLAAIYFPKKNTVIL